MDIAEVSHGYAVEKDLDRLITRRSQKGETTQDDSEPGYMESVRRFHERSEAEMRSRWIDFHQNMHRLHSSLAEEHATKAEKLCEKGEENGR